jgi:hypothetical protein
MFGVSNWYLLLDNADFMMLTKAFAASGLKSVDGQPLLRWRLKKARNSDDLIHNSFSKLVTFLGSNFYLLATQISVNLLMKIVRMTVEEASRFIVLFGKKNCAFGTQGYCLLGKFIKLPLLTFYVLFSKTKF